MKPRAGESVAASDRLTWKCPFCEGVVTYAESERGPLLIHQLDPCEKFLALEPDDYIRECREAFARAGN